MMMIKNEHVIPLLVSLPMYALVLKMVAITDLDDPGPYIFTLEETLLMIQAAAVFVEYDYKLDLFDTIVFRFHASDVFDELHARHVKHGEDEFSRFAIYFKIRFSRQEISPT